MLVERHTAFREGERLFVPVLQHHDAGLIAAHGREEIVSVNERCQALGLAEAASLLPEVRLLHARGLQRWLTPALWWSPLRAIEPAGLVGPLSDILISCGGMAGATLSALAGRARTVIVQHPRRDLRRFDLVIANVHDEIAGPNVLVTRTGQRGENRFAKGVGRTAEDRSRLIEVVLQQPRLGEHRPQREFFVASQRR
jgi:hypothetical protein